MKMEKLVGKTIFDDIKIIDNIFSDAEIEKINEFLSKPSWYFGHVSDSNSEISRKKQFWFMELVNEPYFNDYLYSIIKHVANIDYKLARVYANGQTYGQDGSWHVDSLDDNQYTFVYYANKTWETHWQGNTVFLDSETKQTYSIFPKPNRGILFPGKILHYPESPSRDFYGLRTTIAFKLWDASEGGLTTS